MRRHRVRWQLAAGVMAVVTASGAAASCGSDTRGGSVAAKAPRTASKEPRAPDKDRPTPAKDRPAVERPPLSAELRKAVQNARFAEDLVDRLPPGVEGDEFSPEEFAAAAGVPNRRVPNVDVAVIELDPSGRPSTAANVLLSKDYPEGVVVPVDDNLGTSQVRWRRWDTNAWEAGSAGSEDVVGGRERAQLEMMSPYPASVLKLMVGFGVLRLVDRGELSLDEELPYAPENSSCGKPGSRTVGQWFDRMITVSDNQSTCALLKRMHDLGEVDALTDLFADLGLSTLQVRNTNPATGGAWLDLNMSALDTARLLLIVSGAPGTLWRTPGGEPVTADLLSTSSRRYFLDTLADQGLNQALSTTNWCGRDYPAQGIPQPVPKRWIDPADGEVSAAGRSYGQDVRPCNAAAEVSFAHKTGLSIQAGSDAGIVRSLPGAVERNYIVVVFTNLGMRFADANRPADPPRVFPVSYTEKLARLGHDIDTIVAADARPEPG